MTQPVQNIAFVAPRFPEGPTVGGAETLLKRFAVRLASGGYAVTFYTTCARDHFTWRNELPPGERVTDGVRVRRFPVDEDRDIDAFLQAQQRISLGREVTPDDEQAWMNNNVNSRALIDALSRDADGLDRILAGPYLFSLVVRAAAVRPGKTLLVPCLHDEPFAGLSAIARMFRRVRGCLFNAAPERALAERLFGPLTGVCETVGLGMEPFDSDPGATARRLGLNTPYVVYAGRREPLKGTPLLLDYLAAFRARTARDLHLVLTGTGPVEPPAALRGAVHDLGFVPERDKHDAMAGALAFCHPSVNESFGIVLMEAWLAGTPALVHAGSEVLVHQCRRGSGGLWFRTYPEFEEELVLLWDEPETHRALAAAGRQFVREEYAWPVVEARLIEALAR